MTDTNDFGIPNKKPKKETDDFRLLVTQIIVCIIAVLAALSVKFIGGDIYKQSREKYQLMFDDETSASEILETIAGVLDVDIPKDKTSSESSDASSGGASSQSEDSSSQASSGGVSSGDSSSSASSGGTESEEEDDAAFVQDYSSVSETLTKTATTINTVMAPVSGNITSPYGYRIHPITGVYSMHGGIDIGANFYTPISAAQKGTVKTVSYSSSYGNYIIVSHEGGLETLYAHCSSISAKAGEEVQRGQTIAKVGSTGASTGPHVHFEVRINGVKINPEWVLGKVKNT